MSMLSDGKDASITYLTKLLIIRVSPGDRNKTAISRGDVKITNFRKIRLPGYVTFLYAL